MESPNRLLSLITAVQKVLLDSLTQVGGDVSEKQLNDFMLLRQCLTQLKIFCAKNPQLPEQYLFSLYHACWTHVRVYPGHVSTPKMRRSTWKVLSGKIAAHLFSGGKITSLRQAAMISGLNLGTLYLYYPQEQHLILAVMDEMMKDKK